VIDAGNRIIEVENSRPESATAGFIFAEMGDGFKNPAPPKPNSADDEKTSNAGKPVSEIKHEIRKRETGKSFFIILVVAKKYE
jgi:hypothetical protein